MNIAKVQEDYQAFLATCIWLRRCYNIFISLYDSDLETERTLRKTAGLFFTDLHQILHEYFFLQVRKISDPSATRGNNARENLSITNINESLIALGKMTAEIENLSVEIHQYRHLILDIPNRVVAHADKSTILAQQIVGEHSAEELEKFMENIQSYTDAVGIALEIGPLNYRAQPGQGDVTTLIRSLKDYLRYSQQARNSEHYSRSSSHLTD